MAGQSGYVRLPPANAPPRVWMPSLFDTVHQVLHQVVYSGILAPALIWGAGALVLPWIAARPAVGREPGGWLVLGALLLSWSVTVALLTRAVLAATSPGVKMPSDGVILGVLAAAVVGGLPRSAVLTRSLGHAPAPGRDSRSMETR
jgi:hypothetical protein